MPLLGCVADDDETPQEKALLIAGGAPDVRHVGGRALTIQAECVDGSHHDLGVARREVSGAQRGRRSRRATSASISPT